MVDAFSLITQVFAACSEWFSLIMTATGAGGILISVVFITLVIDILLAPIFGHRGSDPAGPKKKKDNED